MLPDITKLFIFLIIYVNICISFGSSLITNTPKIDILIKSPNSTATVCDDKKNNKNARAEVVLKIDFLFYINDDEVKDGVIEYSSYISSSPFSFFFSSILTVEFYNSKWNDLLSLYESEIILDGNKMSSISLHELVNGTIWLNNLMPGNRNLEVIIYQSNPKILMTKSLVNFTVVCKDEIDTYSVTSRNYEIMDINRTALFDQIYKHNLWNNNESASGPGSARQATQRAMKFIKDILVDKKQYNVLKLFDVPCGDANWMDFDFLNEQMIGYVGMDVSAEVISRNREAFLAIDPGTGTGTNRKHFINFSTVDILSDDLPIMGHTDLLLCRHLMLHIPVEQNMKLLRKLLLSGAGWLLLSTQIRCSENYKEFTLFLGHKINLLKQPYCVRNPTELRLDNGNSTYLALWDIRNYNQDNMNDFFDFANCN